MSEGHVPASNSPEHIPLDIEKKCTLKMMRYLLEEGWKDREHIHKRLSRLTPCSSDLRRRVR